MKNLFISKASIHSGFDENGYLISEIDIEEVQAEIIKMYKDRYKVIPTAIISFTEHNIIISFQVEKILPKPDILYSVTKLSL